MNDSTDQAPPENTQPRFADLGLGDSVLAALDAVGYESPSAIQAQTIPPLLEGRDVLGLAQTGTGKTAAFALPILDRLETGPGSPKVPQALVLAPTRELALQVCEAFERYAAKTAGVRVLPVYGGQGYGIQLSALRRGVHVVVGTPGRIMDHLDRGTLDLTQLRYLVLDEADEMLNMGFAEDVEKILTDTPDDKQVALFSATMPKAIRKLSESYLTDPVEVRIQATTQSASNIRQRYLIASFSRKIDALTRILEVETFDAMIVFVRTKNVTETLAEKLRARGFSAMAINGDVPQAARERTVESFKNGTLDILVATDVAARGLDVERVSHVVNFDIPTDTESYVHRIGRTGRAGRSGDAISFVTPRERYLLRHIDKATKQPLEEMKLPSVEDVNSTRLTRFDDRITEALNSSDLDFYKDVVTHYISEHDVPELDVAAALAIATQGDTPLLMEPEPERPPRRDDRFDRGDRGDRRDNRKGDRGGRDDRGKKGRTSDRGPSGPTQMYRIAVGKKHRIEPGMIVGALANEGGLGRNDFGKIIIREHFSLVELPAKLGRDTLSRLSDTQIKGKPINIAPDSGPPGGKREHRPRRD